tara:strand:- start:2 stop:406 length:405 start_codon:yes stop_codon:yes gene_type:complete
MSKVGAPDELPCERCGEMTAYDGAIYAKLPCEHCGASRPHTMEETGKVMLPFIIFFVSAIPVALILGDEAILILFPLFILLIILVIRHHLSRIPRQKREKSEGKPKGKFRLFRRNARQPIKLPTRSVNKEDNTA